MTTITQQTEDGAAKIITGLDDIALVDTPVKISVQTTEGPVPEIGHEPRACLFDALTQGVFPPVTVITKNHWGDILLNTGRLVSVTVEPQRWHKQKSWKLSIDIIKPGNHHSSPFGGEFPVTPLLLMWGMHDTLLNHLPEPPLTFAPAWREVARRCHATGQVWLDTVEAAIKDHDARRVEHD
jgi:hypothetical protein